MPYFLSLASGIHQGLESYGFLIDANAKINKCKLYFLLSYRNGQMNLIVSKVSDHHQQQQPALPHLVAGSAESWMQPAMYHQHLPVSHNQPAAAVPTATSSGGTTNHYIDECQNQYEVPHAHEAANGRVAAAGGKPLYGYKMY